jgi:hypothetical protein
MIFALVSLVHVLRRIFAFINLIICSAYSTLKLLWHYDDTLTISSHLQQFATEIVSTICMLSVCQQFVTALCVLLMFPYAKMKND